MQTITFTTEDELSRLLSDMAKERNKATSEIIAESLRYYAKMLQKKKLQQQIKQASVLVAKQSLEVNQLLQASDADGV